MITSTDPPEGTTVSQQTTQTRQLVRRTDDKVIAGVASGFAAYLGVDPVLVRVGFVLAATMGGFGILAYIVMWVLTPEGEGGQAPVESRRDTGFWVAIGLFVLAALAIVDNVADRSFVWPIVLIAAGVALWRRSGSPGSPGFPGSSMSPESSDASELTMPTTTVPSNTDEPSAVAPTEPVAPVAPEWTPPPPPEHAPTAHTPRPPKAPRESSRLGGLTIAVALLVSGIGWALDLADVISYPAATAFATALGILAAGLVVGTWVGRARWLVFPALALTPLVVLFGVSDNLDLRLGSGIGERNYRPLTAEAVEENYSLGLGQLTLDLTDLDLAAADTITTHVSLGAGELRILVPEDVDVTIEYELSAGDLSLFAGTEDARQDSGTSLDGVLVSDADDESAGRMVIEVDQTFGELNVVRR
jgi:phage shock protein PspC (stress-responsive transcriptional regulator)/predicted membrane protein